MWQIIVGFAVGLITSWVFWQFLLFLKPKFKICPEIAKINDTRSLPNEYRIKVVNLSNRPVINLYARCTIEWKVAIPGGKKSLGSEIPINTEKFPVLGGKDTLRDAFGINPVRYFVLSEDLEGLLAKRGDGSRIVFTLSGTDAKSGSAVTKIAIYGPDDIRPGNFKAGLKCEI